MAPPIRVIQVKPYYLQVSLLRLPFLHRLQNHGGMLQASGYAWDPPLCITRSTYLFAVKYIVALLAMTEKNISPSTFRRQTYLNWVITVELSSLEIPFAFLHYLHIYFFLHAACSSRLMLWKIFGYPFVGPYTVHFSDQKLPCSRPLSPLIRLHAMLVV